MGLNGFINTLLCRVYKRIVAIDKAASSQEATRPAQVLHAVNCRPYRCVHISSPAPPLGVRYNILYLLRECTSGERAFETVLSLAHNESIAAHYY